ncbi:unknown [Bacteroides sp. CAG:754]|nr:unknown [Bacteroides sp. CAG:754]
MQAGIEGLFVTEVLVENHILGSQHRFASYVVRIHTLPTARDGTAVEDNHQSVVVCITEDLFIQTHRFLFVATEEIDFDSFHPKALQPFHFTLADDGVIHMVDRPLFYIIPIAGRTIP